MEWKEGWNGSTDVMEGGVEEGCDRRKKLSGRRDWIEGRMGERRGVKVDYRRD